MSASTRLLLRLQHISANRKNWSSRRTSTNPCVLPPIQRVARGPPRCRSLASRASTTRKRINSSVWRASSRLSKRWTRDRTSADALPSIARRNAGSVHSTSFSSTAVTWRKHSCLVQIDGTLDADQARPAQPVCDEIVAEWGAAKMPFCLQPARRPVTVIFGMALSPTRKPRLVWSIGSPDRGPTVRSSCWSFPRSVVCPVRERLRPPKRAIQP